MKVTFQPDDEDRRQFPPIGGLPVLWTRRRINALHSMLIAAKFLFDAIKKK
jgi:hypothetical protein